MANKTKTTNANTGYVGGYVKEIIDVLVASALSGRHAVLLSAPGYGKTRIARRVAEAIYEQRIDVSLNGKGNGAWIFLRLEASTPPEVVKGLPDPAKMIEIPPRIEYDRNGTAYDQRAKLILMDEIFRPSDVVFDTVLDVADRQDESIDDPTILWGTSNFVATGDRLSAVRDRIALWKWVSPEVNFYDVALQHLMRSVGSDLVIDASDIPTLQRISTVRAARPSKQTAMMIAAFCDNLAKEAQAMQQPMHINPRRIEHWQRILYTVSVHKHDMDNFDAIHPDAITSLRSAWPSFDAETYRRWGQIIDKVSDVVASAISAALEGAYTKFQEVSTAPVPASVRLESLGSALSEARESLARIANAGRGNSTTMLDDAMQKLDNAYAEAASRSLE